MTTTHGRRLLSALAASLALLPRIAAAGNLTSAQELAGIADAADQGVESAVSVRQSVHQAAKRSWRWGGVSGTFVTTLRNGSKVCHPESDPERVDYLKEGAPDAYVKVLAYHLRAETQADLRLSLVAEARRRLLDLVDTSGFHGLDGADWSGGNQCILELSISIPVWIETALLLEGTPAWSAADREAFAGWLAEEVYPKVAWASRVRRNNWGAAGSLAASLVARYVEKQGLALQEVEPDPRSLDARTAWNEHDDIQLARIQTWWPGDSECPAYGIQGHGGIPDELRRGSGGCNATAIPSADDSGHSYQTMHVEILVYHAEALRRAGDATLYAAATPAGDPAILQAILFVIDNPAGGSSWPWGMRTGALRLAWRVYGDPRLAAAADAGESFRGGRTLPYATFAPPLAPFLLEPR